MDPTPAPSESASSPTGATLAEHRKLWIALLVIAGLTILVITVLTSARKEKLVWLPDNALSRAMQPSPYARLRYNLIRWTAPLWRWHRSHRPNIKVNSKLVELAGASVIRAELGSATGTNADGTRAWILSAEQFAALKPKIAAEKSEVSETSITVYNGGPARATLGPSSMYTPTIGGAVPVGLTVDVMPSLAGHSIRIVLGASYTRVTNTAPAKFTLITNFSAACKVLVPNGGGLVLENPGTNYLFLVSPIAVDSRGNPLKL
jgi:hypothetical protein